MRQALEMALEALEAALSDDKPYIENSKQAITAIKQALAQPEQEPVAWVGPWHDCRLTLIPRHSHQTFEREQPLYTTPPQRTWVGLTDSEIGTIAYNVNPLDGIRQFSRAIEAKLKEKNT